MKKITLALVFFVSFYSTMFAQLNLDGHRPSFTCGEYIFKDNISSEFIDFKDCPISSEFIDFKDCHGKSTPIGGEFSVYSDDAEIMAVYEFFRQHKIEIEERYGIELVFKIPRKPTEIEKIYGIEPVFKTPRKISSRYFVFSFQVYDRKLEGELKKKNAEEKLKMEEIREKLFEKRKSEITEKLGKF